MKLSQYWRGDTSGGGDGSIGERCVTTIRDRMRDGHIDASGETSASLGYKESEFDLEIFAEGPHAPFRTTQHGAKPTPKNGPGFLQEIINWTYEKNLDIEPRGMEDEFDAHNRVGRAIYRKIWSEGTDRYQVPRSDIYSPALALAVDEFTAKVAGAVVKKIID